MALTPLTHTQTHQLYDITMDCIPNHPYTIIFKTKLQWHHNKTGEVWLRKHSTCLPSFWLHASIVIWEPAEKEVIERHLSCCLIKGSLNIHSFEGRRKEHSSVMETQYLFKSSSAQCMLLLLVRKGLTQTFSSPEFLYAMAFGHACTCDRKDKARCELAGGVHLLLQRLLNLQQQQLSV